MVRRLSSFIFPPYAVAHYGCHSHCAPAVTSVWLSGLLLLLYHLFAAPSDNQLITWGSLLGGGFLVLIAGIWALLTVRRADEESSLASNTPTKWRSLFSDVDERDPLKETDRIKQL